MGSPNTVPAVETPADDAGPGRSTIKFPYLDQDDSVEIAKAVHAVAGNSCERDALAAHLDVAAKGGGFNLRLLTAKMFGFIDSDKGTISLTHLGIRAVDPQTEKAARAESFLLVPLYKAVYDDYKGQMLPPNPALEAAMEKLGVAPKQRDKARQVFQRSATQAGYFAYGTSRLVAPPVKATAAETITPAADAALGGGGGGGTGIVPPEPPKLNPFIVGLLAKLPEADKPWSKEGRRKWLQTASNIFDLMYAATAEDDDDELNITITKSSAN